MALDQCKPKIEEFVKCSKESGLLVVFKCRDHNKAMNECLNSYNTKEKFEEYKKKREAEVLEASQSK